jgi:hypothetical protein
MIKGASFQIVGVVYQDQNRLVVQDITTASVTVVFKKSANDTDAQALFTRSIGSGVILSDPTNGIFTCDVTASSTNNLSYQTIYWEAVVVVGATVIRTGIKELVIDGNVLKTLP